MMTVQPSTPGSESPPRATGSASASTTTIAPAESVQHHPGGHVQQAKPIVQARTLRVGGLELASRWWLSPLAGFTNLPFRRVIREIAGVGLCTTDLVNARGLLAGSPKTLELIATCADDSPLFVQIFGSEPLVMAEAARRLEAWESPGSTSIWGARSTKW